MEITHIIVLSLVQGITEFLPISSSAHLILVPQLTGWADQGLTIDVATHIGTLAAVMLYFWREVWRMARGTLAVAGLGDSADVRLLRNVAIGTVPVVVAGLLLEDLVAGELRNAALIAWATILFGLLLWLADRRRPAPDRSVDAMPAVHAATIGLAQALALIPGVSRSGITMTAGRFLGYPRTEAARFSLLLSIPTTAAAGLLVGAGIYRSGDASLQADAVLVGLLSGIAAWIAIAGLMRWLREASFTPFVVYRLVLGAGLLVWLHLAV